MMALLTSPLARRLGMALAPFVLIILHFWSVDRAETRGFERGVEYARMEAEKHDRTNAAEIRARASSARASGGLRNTATGDQRGYRD